MARAYSSYLNRPGQQRPIPGREPEMTPNNAGGFGFILDDWERLNRFLILGSENGTYYVRENVLTAQNAEVVIRCLKADGVRTVNAARDVNVNNRAPKVDSQLFTLALALQHGDQPTKNAAIEAAKAMLRTGGHVLMLAALVAPTKWNRTKRRIFSEWFLQGDANKTAFQILKYRNRNGWMMRDLLRLAHPKPDNILRDIVFAWASDSHEKFHDKRKQAGGEVVPVLEAFEEMARSIATTGEIVGPALVALDKGLPREALPTEALTDLEVLRRLLAASPPHALLRNLARFSSRSILDEEESRWVAVKKLTNVAAMQRARVHPFAVMLALMIYQGGTSPMGRRKEYIRRTGNVSADREQRWVPQPAIVAALTQLFKYLQASAEPTNQRILFAVDISGSMWSQMCEGVSIAAADAANAVVLALAAVEPNADVIQFATQGGGLLMRGGRNAVIREIKVTKETSLSELEVPEGVRGGTDLAIPVMWAKQERKVYDAFVLLTDNETWAGSFHASDVLRQYRQQLNANARMVCASMAANHANIVDPTDPLSMGCAGLDSNLAQLISGFIGQRALAAPVGATEDDD